MIADLLDTNIISNAVKAESCPVLLAWFADRADEELFIASFTLAEIRRGILEMSSGRKRDELERWFSSPEGPQALFQGRILPFDDRTAMTWAELMAQGKSRGRPRSAIDIVIAAFALASGCIVVTDD